MNAGAAGRETRCCDCGADGGGGVARSSRMEGAEIEPKVWSDVANIDVTGIGVAGVDVADTGGADARDCTAATLGIPFGGVGATTRGERSLRPQS